MITFLLVAALVINLTQTYWLFWMKADRDRVLSDMLALSDRIRERLGHAANVVSEHEAQLLGLLGQDLLERIDRLETQMEVTGTLPLNRLGAIYLKYGTPQEDTKRLLDEGTLAAELSRDL